MRYILFFLILVNIVYANANNITKSNTTTLNSDNNISLTKMLNLKIDKLRKELTILKNSKELSNEWINRYSSYFAHKELVDKKNSIDKKIYILKYFKSLTKKQKKQLKILEKKRKVLKDKISLTKEFEKEPFKKLILPPKLDNAPKISNPFSLISGLSYIKELNNNKNKYINEYKRLEDTINMLLKQESILRKITKIDNNPINKQQLKAINNEIKQFLTIKDIFKTTKNLYIKKSNELKTIVEADIKKESKKIVYIGTIAFIFLLVFIFLKYLIQKYLSDRDSFYTINKIMNIIFITILLLTLLFAYLENVSYLITILGFASAGIAIALKDWFMSLLGWFVIVIGGTIHVGDRVKFMRGNMECIGDVIDISLLRITIQEDITLTTYMNNRRAGRIIFVPNNYIFTDMVANYSHAGIKTVWDGIDFYITYDSNIEKTTTIVKNIAKQYSKGYTDLRRKQLNRLRSRYQLKNTNVEPRIFSFIENYGMKISVWYLTNSYATLTLRSTISAKIIEELLTQEDIKLAYPTQALYINKSIPKAVQLIEEIDE